MEEFKWASTDSFLCKKINHLSCLSLLWYIWCAAHHAPRIHQKSRIGPAASAYTTELISTQEQISLSCSEIEIGAAKHVPNTARPDWVPCRRALAHQTHKESKYIYIIVLSWCVFVLRVKCSARIFPCRMPRRARIIYGNVLLHSNFSGLTAFRV